MIENTELGRHGGDVALQRRDLLHLVEKVPSHGVLQTAGQSSSHEVGAGERTLRSTRKRIRSRCSASHTESSSKHEVRRSGSLTAGDWRSALSLSTSAGRAHSLDRHERAPQSACGPARRRAGTPRGLASRVCHTKRVSCEGTSRAATERTWSPRDLPERPRCRRQPRRASPAAPRCEV